MSCSSTKGLEETRKRIAPKSCFVCVSGDKSPDTSLTCKQCLGFTGNGKRQDKFKRAGVRVINARIRKACSDHEDAMIEGWILAEEYKAS
jgi:hypothetical protein